MTFDDWFAQRVGDDHNGPGLEKRRDIAREAWAAARVSCAQQVTNMAFSITRICSEPNVSQEIKELGKIRAEALADAAAALLDPDGRRPEPR